MSRRTIGAALIFLIAAGAGDAIWLTRARRSAAARAADPPDALPVLAVSSADARAITRIQLRLQPAEEDGPSPPQTVVLARTAAGWEVTAPFRAPASADKVQALIDNLQTLQAWKVVDHTTLNDDLYQLTEAKALHIAAWTPTRQVVNLYCGKSSILGQLARIGGADQTLALVNWGKQGYAGFLYTRDPRGWRDTSIFRFDARAVVRIEIANRRGVLVLAKGAAGDRWEATVARRRGGRLGAARPWDGVDGAKIGEMLSAYQSLAADDFGADADRPGAGIEDAEQTGGVIRIRLRGATSDLVLRVGKPSTLATRWAIKDSRWAVRGGGDGGTLYSLSPWTARWALAGPDAFGAARAAAR